MDRGNCELVTAAQMQPLPGDVLEGSRDWWDANRPGWVDPGWWDMPVRREVAALLRLPAGPQLLAAASGLASGRCPAEHGGEQMPGMPVPGSSPGFPCGCQIVLVTAWQAIAAWAGVHAAAVLTDAAGAEPVVLKDDYVRPGITDPAREEVALALRIPPRSAGAAIAAARDLAAFPEAAALAASGIVPLRAVARVCREAAGLSPGDARDVIAGWVEKVSTRAAGRSPMTSSAAVRAARRLILAAPSHVEARRRARAGRRVELWDGDDGTATLAAVLPQETALRIHRRLTAMARGLDDPADPDGPRGIDARRADLLADILLGDRATRCTGVEVNVIIPVTALLGLTGEAAEIPGLGPVPSEVARELAADGTWRAWLTKADGTVVVTSAEVYRPTASLARLVRAREPYCRMPDCSTPAAQCDLDHAVPWPDGPTTAENLGPLCRRHHIQRTHYGWDLDPEQNCWRTPAGAQAGYAAA